MQQIGCAENPKQRGKQAIYSGNPLRAVSKARGNIHHEVCSEKLKTAIFLIFLSVFDSVASLIWSSDASFCSRIIKSTAEQITSLQQNNKGSPS
jgi:hypothetical protein